MPSIKSYTPDEMRSILRQFIQSKGSLVAAADALSTTQSHLSRILSGERSIGDSIASQLGFEVVKQKVKTTVIFYIGETRS